MQTRSGRRDGPGPLGKDRLVALAVLWLVAAGDVRRQRNVAEPFDRFMHVAWGCEPKAAQPVFAAADYFGDKFCFAEFDALAQPHFSARPDQGLPFFL